MEASGGGDDKWKLSKKGKSRSGRNYYYADAAGASTSTSTSSGGGGLSRSYSASVTATRDGATASSSSSEQQRQEQETRRRLSKKCVEAVKEHRARFYIVRRCVSMLVCWRDYYLAAVSGHILSIACSSCCSSYRRTFPPLFFLFHFVLKAQLLMIYI
jgi:hypothetical protein